MAEAFGIRTVDSGLIRLKSGELGYITKQIDRLASDEKIHMMDMLQILESFDKYRGGSMEKIGKALNNYSANPLLDKIFYYDLAIFSFITGNNDMHLKNFSMIEAQSRIDNSFLSDPMKERYKNLVNERYSRLQ